MPVPEDVNHYQMKVEALQRMAHRWQKLDKWQLRRIAGSIIGGVVVESLIKGGGALKNLGLAYAGSEALIPLTGKFIDQAAVMRWLAETPATEAKILDDPRIPEDDRIKVKSTLTELAAEHQHQAYQDARAAADRARIAAWKSFPGDDVGARAAGERAFNQVWKQEQVKLSKLSQQLLGRDNVTRIRRAAFTAAATQQGQRDAATTPRRYEHTAVSATGHRIGTNDGGTTWHDVTTGQQTHGPTGPTATGAMLAQAGAPAA